jgi:hypothetical protein
MLLLAVNWYKIFYFMALSDGIKSFFDTTSNIFTVSAVISFILLLVTSIGRSYVISENRLQTTEEEKKDADTRSWEFARKHSSRIFWVALSLAIFTWLGYVLVPTKKECLFIVAGGAAASFVSSDSSVKALPADLTKYVHLSLKEKISELTDDDRKEIGLTTKEDSVKNNLIDKVKELTKDEIIEQIKKGSLFDKKDQ